MGVSLAFPPPTSLSTKTLNIMFSFRKKSIVENPPNDQINR